MNVQICQITLYASGSTVGIYRNGIAVASFFYYRSITLFDGDIFALVIDDGTAAYQLGYAAVTGYGPGGGFVDGDVCAAFTAVVIRSALAVRRFFAIWRAISVIVFILSVLIFV